MPKVVPKGPIRLIREPEPDAFYVIGADVAENVPDGWVKSELRGIEHEGEARADFDAAEVFDYDTHEQMAEVHARMDLDEYAILLAALGIYYNAAHLAVEAVGVGQAVVTYLANTLFYPNLHYFQPRFDRKMNIDRPGFWTTAKGWYAKSEQVDCLRKHIRDWTWIPHTRELIEECQQYEVDYMKRKTARYGARQGAHDDRVSAAMIAMRAMEHPQCAPPRTAEDDFHRRVVDAGIVPEIIRRDPWASTQESEGERLLKWIHR